MTDDGPNALELLWSAVLNVGLLILGWFHLLQREEVRTMKDEIANAQKRADDVGKALNAHQLHAAEKFATKQDVRELGDKIDRRFDRLDDKMDELTERLPPKSH